MHFAEGSRVLFVGEGDFSFVTSLTHQDGCAGIHLTATSLQEELSERARRNVDVLMERGVNVVLGVDATRLHLHPLTQHLRFTHVVFNFPHVGGKMRIDLNRKLLREFFQSAVQVLEGDGRVVVTLCGGQAGVTLDPVVRRWDDSWKVVLMASYADLVLRSVEKFSPDIYLGYSATGYRSLEKGFCQDGALTFVFQGCKLPSEPVNAEATENVLLCDGSYFTLPSFLHTQIQRDVIADKSSFVGYLYNLLLVLLSANLTVRCQERLVYKKETQHVNLRKCESVSKSADLSEHVLCHPSYRINSEQGIHVEPVMILFISGNTQLLDSNLSKTINLNVQNLSQSFTPEAKNFTFMDFTDHKTTVGNNQDCEGTVTCYIINLVTLARHCGGVEDDEIWGHGQCVNLRDDTLTYTPWSLFPGQYIYDLSFWESATPSNENDAPISDTSKRTFDTIVANVGRDAVKSCQLLGTYDHPVLKRRSSTYRIVYRSWHGALSDEGAKALHSQIGLWLEKCLGVEVR